MTAVPLYEYLCASCGHRVEVLQRLDDTAPDCAECGQPTMTKQISRTNFALKGTGWYKDHYGLKPPTKE